MHTGGLEPGPNMEDASSLVEPDPDPLQEALGLIDAAQKAGLPLRLLGGLAVRILCPDFPPRARKGQDLDLASVSVVRPQLTELMVRLGYEPDKRFNALYGHKQLYFRSPRGRTVDVLVDRLEMCHELAFGDRIERMPLTLDVTDLLLTKLQIVELNEKDAQDVVYLLAMFPVTEGDAPATIGLDRVRAVLGSDWGWWRTVSLNLARIRKLAVKTSPGLVPRGATHDVVAQLDALGAAAQDGPKSLRWKVRSKVGERKRWYRVPQEDSHA